MFQNAFEIVKFEFAENVYSKDSDVLNSPPPPSQQKSRFRGSLEI